MTETKVKRLSPEAWVIQRVKGYWIHIFLFTIFWIAVTQLVVTSYWQSSPLENIIVIERYEAEDISVFDTEQIVYTSLDVQVPLTGRVVRNLVKSSGSTDSIVFSVSEDVNYPVGKYDRNAVYSLPYSLTSGEYYWETNASFYLPRDVIREVQFVSNVFDVHDADMRRS